MPTDREWMRRALEVSERAEGHVSPRPAVGAVVTDAQGRLAGEGWTAASPGPHAEVVALAAAGERARGGTLYVTLEPCCHTGATAPCTDAVLRSGVRRVVVARRDPNPVVAGRGLALLRRAGVTVDAGVCSAEAGRFLAPFFRWIRTGRPLLTLKMAASLDGKVAAPDGTSRWISGEASRAEVHRLRARVDGILVGSGTVAADDPALTARPDPPASRQPVRIVVDASGRTPPHARVLDDAAPTIVITTPACPGQVRHGWEARGARVVGVRAGEGGCDLGDAVDALGALGLTHVLVESGPRLAGALVAGGLVQRLQLYLAPIVIGGDAPGLFEPGVKTLADAQRLRIESVTRVGADLRIRATFSEGA